MSTPPVVSRGRAPVGAYFPGSSRRPINHGTIGGYRAHYRHGVPMCEDCRQANREARGENPFRPAPCGTICGYRRHLRLGEETCDACRAASHAAKRRYAKAATR